MEDTKLQKLEAKVSEAGTEQNPLFAWNVMSYNSESCEFPDLMLDGWFERFSLSYDPPRLSFLQHSRLGLEACVVASANTTPLPAGQMRSCC